MMRHIRTWHALRVMIVTMVVLTAAYCSGDTTRYVKPSGDVTGVTDHTNLTAAAQDDACDTIVVNGLYYLRDTLKVGPKLLTGVTVPLATTYPTSTSNGDELRYTGPEATGKYLLECHGGIVSHVQLRCVNRIRGLQVVGSKYVSYAVHTVRIVQPTHMGVDLIDCWGSNIYGLTVIGGRGIAMRLHRCNAMALHNVRLANVYLFRNVDATKNVATWETACDQGQPSAEVLDGYADDWIEPDEGIVRDTSGNLVQTDADARAALVVGSPGHSQSNVSFHTLMLEPLMSGAYPCVSVSGELVRFHNVWLEGGYHRGEIFHVRNPSREIRQGQNVEVDNIRVLAKRNARYMVRCTDLTRFVTVRQSESNQYVSDAIIACDGGTHHGPEVCKAYTAKGVRAIVAINGAEVLDSEPAVAE